eukprot:7763126-Alexandrium_andersonii.AAC.1
MLAHSSTHYCMQACWTARICTPTPPPNTHTHTERLAPKTHDSVQSGGVVRASALSARADLPALVDAGLHSRERARVLAGA